MTMSGNGRVTFVLGGARSGKSRFAEDMAFQTGLERHYLATSQIFDDEMRERVQLHRQQRDAEWVTHEEPLQLAETLTTIQSPQRVVLIDCLTLWLTNLMMAERDVVAESQSLVEGLAGLRGHFIFVSNEVGLGIVPENRMARQFRDHAGRLHQMLAAKADDVFFVAAGLPLKMKG